MSNMTVSDDGQNKIVPRGRSIGDILVASGRITTEDAARILQLQQKENIPFGEAAVSMQLLTREDIVFALAKQYDYAYLSDQDTSVSPELVAAYKPFSTVGERLRAIRSQLSLRWLNGDPLRKTIAVVSPRSGEGKSFISANLAVVFAQQGYRTLLIDGNLRGGRQHHLFKLGRNPGLSAVLADRVSAGDVITPVQVLPGLSVLPSGPTPPNPQELLGRSGFSMLLMNAAQHFEVVLVDTPAGQDSADAEIIASRAGSAIMIVRKNTSLMADSINMSRSLRDSGVAMVGSILNDD